MGKVELLAPAGNVECFYAAINAGADAVYLAGQRFGARASATNFNEEELVRVLDLAHLHGKKIYLTLNTLIKEREWADIHDFLAPLVEHRLDGVIIQDVGLIDYIAKEFPELVIHISTQMTVTGKYGAKLLKDMGITRIVPARELSLDEIKEIKDNVDIEIESFIHGAMCYSYSGQCLFSSYLGGRSGNRGRCAGPCRLSYTICTSNRNANPANIEYPLSLKDMCTARIIGELIDAGIDSFKIEGRLKSPEYVAGVTSIYRKYIDMYYETGEAEVTAGDMEILKSLYIRSKLQTGYYHTHNGENMITKDNPSYNTTDDKIVKKIHDKYVKDIDKIPVYGHTTLVAGENATMLLKYGDILVRYDGDIVDKALNKPLSYDDVHKQLTKIGNLPFEFEKLDIEIDDDCFMAVKQLNELRRGAFNMLKEAVIDAKFKS